MVLTECKRRRNQPEQEKQADRSHRRQDRAGHGVHSRSHKLTEIQHHSRQQCHFMPQWVYLYTDNTYVSAQSARTISTRTRSVGAPGVASFGASEWLPLSKGLASESESASDMSMVYDEKRGIDASGTEGRIAAVLKSPFCTRSRHKRERL